MKRLPDVPQYIAKLEHAGIDKPHFSAEKATKKRNNLADGKKSNP